MAGKIEVNFELHLAATDEAGNRCEKNNAVFYAVVMKTGPGQYDWLASGLPKRMAARKMRQIRREMAEMWWKANVGKQSH